MTGVEHYREAEQQAEAAAYFFDEGKPERAQQRIDLAQAHATLALAAATALTGAMAADGYDDEPELKAWRAAAGAEVDRG
ncbi:hypothetical protein J5X84_36395 [Streptosporangiaceae bacterium NEAU-GS5]|nr:hypothetical protein [Streptosporangiaceae bacterium NEAU-GS5]